MHFEFRASCFVFPYHLCITLLDSLLLGIIQGITEFLPISSDGHLVLAGILLGRPLQGTSALGFDLLLHLGSLLALFVCDGKRWLRLLFESVRPGSTGQRFIALLVLGTVPGAVAGVFLKDVIATELRTVVAAAIGFLVTALFLLCGEFFRRRAAVITESSALPRVSFLQTLIIGFAQAAAILPGVSRSGLTIATGMMTGLSRSDALTFSFLLAVPIIGGATADALLDVWQGEVLLPGAAACALGLGTSFVVSCMAILMLRSLVGKYSVAWFAVYLVPLGLSLLFL